MASVDQALAHLTQRARDRRLRREAEAQEIRRRVLDVLSRQLPPGAEAWLIGSLAWGEFGGRSDVDVVVRNLSREASLVIERSIADASGAEVELLDFALLSEKFRSRVLSEGIFVGGA